MQPPEPSDRHPDSTLEQAAPNLERFALPHDPSQMEEDHLLALLIDHMDQQLEETDKTIVDGWLEKYPEIMEKYHAQRAMHQLLSNQNSSTPCLWSAVADQLYRDEEIAKQGVEHPAIDEELAAFEPDEAFISAYSDGEIPRLGRQRDLFERLLPYRPKWQQELTNLEQLKEAYYQFVKRLESRVAFDCTFSLITLLKQDEEDAQRLPVSLPEAWTWDRLVADLCPEGATLEAETLLAESAERPWVRGDRALSELIQGCVSRFQTPDLWPALAKAVVAEGLLDDAHGVSQRANRDASSGSSSVVLFPGSAHGQKKPAYLKYVFPALASAAGVALILFFSASLNPISPAFSPVRKIQGESQSLEIAEAPATQEGAVQGTAQPESSPIAAAVPAQALVEDRGGGESSVQESAAAPSPMAESAPAPKAERKSDSAPSPLIAMAQPVSPQPVPSLQRESERPTRERATSSEVSGVAAPKPALRVATVGFKPVASIPAPAAAPRSQGDMVYGDQSSNTLSGMAMMSRNAAKPSSSKPAVVPSSESFLFRRVDREFSPEEINILLGTPDNPEL